MFNKRLIGVFFLSFIIIFAPIYANAILPLLASAASVAGRVLVGTAVRRVPLTLVKRATPTLVGLCSKNLFTSALCTSVPLALINNALTDEEIITETIINNDNSVEINYYRLTDECTLDIGFGANGSGQYNTADVDYIRVYESYDTSSPDYSRYGEGTSDGLYEYTKIHDEIVASRSGIPQPDWTLYSHLITSYTEHEVYVNGNGGQSHIKETKKGSTSAYYRCVANQGKEYVSPTEINNIIKNTLNQNDYSQLIENVYNTDYSQHPNITINNNSSNSLSLNGPDFNNSIKTAPIDFEVSPRLSVKIGDDIVNMDDINDDNCTKDDNGAYDRCDGLEDSDDDDDDNDNDDDNDSDDDDDDPTCPADYTYNPSTDVCVLDDNQTDPQPTACTTNGLTQKFCDWMDWTQKPPEIEVPTEVEIQEPDDVEIDKNLISLGSGSCPSNTSVTYNFMGSHTVEFDNAPACDIARMISPFIMIAAMISSIYTYAGISRGNGDD